MTFEKWAEPNTAGSAAERPKNVYTYRDNSDPEKPVIFETISDSILKADEAYAKETGNDPQKQAHVGCEVESLLEKQKKELADFITNVLEKEGLTFKEYAEREEKSVFEDYLKKLGLNERALKDKKMLDIGADKRLFASYCLKHGISREAYSVEGGDDDYIKSKIRDALWTEEIRKAIEEKSVKALAQKLPFTDESFELILNCAALPGRNKEYFGGLTMEEDVDLSYEEIVRVLKSGGEARLESFEDDESDEFFGDWCKATKRKLEELAKRGNIEIEMQKSRENDAGCWRIIIRKK